MSSGNGSAGRRPRALRPVLVAVAVALAALMLAACGSDDDAGGGDAAAAPAETAAVTTDGGAAAPATELAAEPSTDLCPDDGSRLVFGYDVFSDTQEFAAARWEGMQEWADRLGCIEFVKAVDNADGATALANVKTFINRDVDGVLLLQVVSDAQAGLVRALDAAEIPVMATDIVAPGAPFLSASDQGAGEQAGQALVDAYRESGATDTPWVVLGKTPVAGPEVARRMEGAQQVLEKELGVPGDQFLTVDVNQQTAQEAFDRARQIQGRIPEGSTVLVTAVNDEIALGTFRALSRSGRDFDIRVVGIGGLSAGLQAVCQFPEWYATIDYDGRGQTGFIIDGLMRMAAGQEIPEVFHTPTAPATRDVVAEKYPEQCDG